jgi:spermidine synthase
MQARYAGALVFVASGSVLVLETLAGRLMAPYVGVSLETFTGVIGVVLAGIATGTWSGGRLADRIDPRSLLPAALALGGGAAIAAVPIIRALGPGADGSSPVTIIFLAAMAFFLPAALLSAVSPLTVKSQLRDVEHTGRVVGRVEALGTAGSLVGVFGTGFILVAEFPTTPVVVTLGGLLVVTGAVLWLTRRGGGYGPAVAAGTTVAVLASGAAVLARPPCDVETAYFCARVEVDEDRPSARILWLDDLRHAYVDLDDPTFLEFSYTQLLGDVVDAMAPAGAPLDAVHLGGGGFTLPRYLAATRPGSASLVLELDPGVVRIAEQELGVRPSADLRVRTGDARGHLRDVPADSADLVIGDAFGGRAVPYHLATREFAADVARVLRDDGIYAQNIIDQPPLRFLWADVATLREVFEHVAVLGPAGRFDGSTGGNTVVVASDAPLPLAALRAELAARGADAEVGADATLDDAVGRAEVLTDDYAPVDQLLT